MKYEELIKQEHIRNDIKRVTGFSDKVINGTTNWKYSDTKFECFCYFFEKNRADNCIQYDIDPLKNNMRKFMSITTG